MKTAVEWLEDELKKAEYIPKDSMIMDYVIKLSKEMERKLLYNFYMQGGVDAIMESDRDVEQYYNETFKK
jgi:hypothetical protein